MVDGGLRPPPAEVEAEEAAAAGRGAIFVLEGACLETAKVGKVRERGGGNRCQGRWRSGTGWRVGGRGWRAGARRAAALPPPPLSPACGGQRRRPFFFSSSSTSLSPPLASPPPPQNYTLLNCDDHATFLRKHNRDPAASRPDIAHQALLALYDSPLAKAGRLQGVYVHTARGALVSLHPAVRLPRTFKRFCGLWVQLLHKLAIRASNGPDKLLRVVKGPVARHLPPGAPRIALSRTAPDAVPLKELVAGLEPGVVPVFVVGAMAHGRAEAPYVDR